jgi:uncharacterized damage-inducible protein DinB
MENKNRREPGFKGEFLWELEFLERQLMALAEAIASDRYAWRPAKGARSVSEVFVHVAAGNFILLDMAGGKSAPIDLYPGVEGDGIRRFYDLTTRNEELEKTITDKAEAVRLLNRSLESARECFEHASETELNRTDIFFGELSTVRRVYLRLLLHMSEHMGQMVAYVRSMGMAAPWPSWRRPSKQQ